jgi:hypothetical protein
LTIQRNLSFFVLGLIGLVMSFFAKSVPQEVFLCLKCSVTVFGVKSVPQHKKGWEQLHLTMNSRQHLALFKMDPPHCPTSVFVDLTDRISTKAIQGRRSGS